MLLTASYRSSVSLVVLLLGSVLGGLAQAAAGGTTPLGKAFTYQGLLKQNGAPLDGNVDLKFRLYYEPTGGTSAAEVTEVNYTISDGLLTIILDFDFGFTVPYTGNEYWLEIDVRMAGVGEYETLAPRQLLTAAPYANSFTPRAYVTAAPGNPNPCLTVYNGNPNGTGLWGSAPSGKGVVGQAQVSGFGVYGSPGVLGSSAVGVRGENFFFPSGSNFGELGSITHGVLGSAGASSSYGVHGTHNPTGNYGILGLSNYGVYGQSATTGSDAVRGNHVSGNYGILGQSGAGVVAHGIGAAYGVNAGNPSSGGTAIYATAPFGKAIHAVNANSGHAGYFEGFVYFSNNVGVGVVTPSFRLHLAENSAAKPTSNTWTITSDARLKKNVHQIQHALDSVLALRGVTYQWIDPSSQGGMCGTYTGMIAQDVEKVFPEWISTSPDGYKHLTVIGFEGLVVEALRQLRQEHDAQIAHVRAEASIEIEQLRAEKDSQIALLQEQNAAFEARLAQLEAIIAVHEPTSKGTPR